MAQFPILGLGIQGRSPNVVAQKRLNLFYDIQPQADKSLVAAYGTPGLVSYTHIGPYPLRGLYWMQPTNQLFAVVNTTLYELSPTSGNIARGALSTSGGYVGMADNGTQLMITDGPNGYVYTPSTTTFVKVASSFAGGDTVCFLDGYFIVNRPNTGQFWVSNAYDGTTWNGLNYATAESNPDNLIRVWAERGLLVLFGAISIEFWQNTGALDFTYSRIVGSPSEVGLAARWSLARCAGWPTFLAKTKRGGYIIAQLNGFEAQKLSTPELEYTINHYATVEDAVAFSYTMSGHDFYQINFPSAGMSWLYDANSGGWSQLQSTGYTRHLGDLGVAFGQQIMVSDFSTGNVYTLSDTTYTDNGVYIPRELVGPHLFDSGRLNDVIVSRLRVDMEEGLGLTSGQGSNPQIMLQISRDSGHTWGGELWTSFGNIGQYQQRAEWRRLGLARDWIFKLRVTDPVKVAILGAYIEATVADK